MNKTLLTSFAFFSVTLFFATAQNLVPNPSFEDYIACPTGPSETYKAVPWIQPSGHTGTSDYFHTCNTSPIPINAPPVGVPNNLLGNQAARTGAAYCGFFSIDGPTDGDYREYIQAPLTNPLTVGTRYCVRFYLSLSDLSTNSTDGIGAYFSTQPVSGPGALPLTFPAQVSVSAVITNYTGWEEVYGEFVADQPYAYITIGNFAIQGQTTIQAGPPQNPNPIPPTIPIPGAYYYIDDVYVGESSVCPAPCNLQISNASTVADCNLSNGVAAVTVTGGSGNYSYLWQNGETTQTLTGVGYGFYPLAVGDGPGCEINYNVFVGQNTSLALTFSPGFLQCASQPDGEVDITVTGGTAPYTFLWSTGATTEDLDSVPGGTYTVTVTDAEGCMLTDSMTLTSIFGAQYSIVATDESCAGANNGSMYVTSGTFPPTSYLWNTGATTAGIYNLAPGTYTVEITDFFGCTETLTGTVGSGTGNFNVSISQQGNTLYATPAPNYQWHLNGNPISGATQQTYTITQSGNYYVVATGGGTCVDTSNVIEATFQGTGIFDSAVFAELNAYPNPANDVINIVLYLLKPESIEIMLRDISGRTVYSFTSKEKEIFMQHQIPVSSFAEGIYIVQAQAGNEQKFLKLSVRK